MFSEKKYDEKEAGKDACCGLKKMSWEIQRVSTGRFRTTSESLFSLRFLQVGMEHQQIDRGSYYIQFAFRW